MIRLTCEAEPNNLPPPGKCEARRRGRSAMHRTDQGARAGCLEGFIPQKQSTAAGRMQRNAGVRSAPAQRKSRSSTHIKNIKLTKKFTKGKAWRSAQQLSVVIPNAVRGLLFPAQILALAADPSLRSGWHPDFSVLIEWTDTNVSRGSIGCTGNKAAIKRNVPTVTVLLFALMIVASSDQTKTHKRLR